MDSPNDDYKKQQISAHYHVAGLSVVIKAHVCMFCVTGSAFLRGLQTDIHLISNVCIWTPNINSFSPHYYTLNNPT